MTKTRLEAFSDGVLAIIITIMVLELKVPDGHDWSALQRVVPVLLTYLLSFVFMGIYWSNHHHLLHATHKVNGAILWANLHLLFWLSLTPFVTHWMGETHLAPVPTAVYGVVLLLSAVAYTILQATIIRHEGPHSPLATAVRSQAKEIASLVLYVASVPLALVWPRLSAGIYVTVALMWLVPDRRIERHAG